MINAFDIKMAPERLQCPLMTLMIKNIYECYSLFRRDFHLSLCAVLVAHVGGGVLVDAVVGEMREHVPHLCALVAVLV